MPPQTRLLISLLIITIAALPLWMLTKHLEKIRFFFSKRSLPKYPSWKEIKDMDNLVAAVIVAIVGVVLAVPLLIPWIFFQLFKAFAKILLNRWGFMIISMTIIFVLVNVAIDDHNIYLAQKQAEAARKAVEVEPDWVCDQLNEDVTCPAQLQEHDDANQK